MTDRIRYEVLDGLSLREKALIAVTQWGRALEDVSKELQNDRDVVLAAVTQWGRALEYASKELQDDKEIMGPVALVKGLALLKEEKHERRKYGRRF